ncbi:hypothetical protein C2S52_015108 [Perilla frutescens var. hirtella]|nr:hypothetical protein C2S52_015108 [Perilla frutescens var. hirtella]
MLAHSTLMANSLNSDGGDAASLHRTSTDTALEAPPHINLQFSNGSGSFHADAAANSTSNSVAVTVEETTRDGVVQECDGYDAVLSGNAETGAGGVEEQKQEGVHANCSEKCATETQMIEHAEPIGPPIIGDRKVDDDNDSNMNMKQQEPKGKRPRRRGGKARKYHEVSDCYPNVRREKKGRMYSREELEALRFEKVEEQKKKWVEVYCGLDPVVVAEYDELERAREKDRMPSFNFDPRPQFQKLANLGEVCPKVEGDNLENLNASDHSSFLPVSDDIGPSVVEENYCEDDDSDEEYSIQRPAFFVAGEPDFDSGPPQDGLEYLRRVRWEAARIPKVKVVKVNKVKEQSIYMPQIPDVMKCPEQLLPLKHWEDSFLSDFSQLREAFSQIDLQEPSAETSIKEEFLNQMLEKFVSLESADNSGPSKASSILETSDAKSSPSSPESFSPKVDHPTLSTILKMDSAARTSMLKKRISSTMDMDRLPYNDSLWLFALCVAIDSPLHGDTSAALRSLLRKCASLRAVKTVADDDVIVLNILVTIAGRYFGQLER